MTEDKLIVDLHKAIDDAVDAEIETTKLHVTWGQLGHHYRDAQLSEAIARKEVAWKVIDKLLKEIGAELAKVPEVDEAP